jgi:Cyclic nucleotide-binding domain
MAKDSVAHTLESSVAPALTTPFFDVEGLLKVVVPSPSGEEQIIAILGPGTIVGELAMIGRHRS